jgi:branched-chain amino acid transport system permease protein
MATIETSRPAAGQLYAGLSLRSWRLVGLAALLGVACALPFTLSGYHLSQASQVLVYAMVLLGLNILTGFNGQISLGHGAFYAIGAYTVAILLDKTGIPYWAAIPIAGALCLIVGFLFGLPALRLEGLYLALATLALAVATPQILKYDAFDDFTGGVQGISVIMSAPSWIGLTTDQWLYYFTLLWTVPIFVVGWNLLRGRTGRAMVAIRDHPLAAAGMGINTALYKSLTFGVSAMFTGIAGGLGVLIAQFVSPDSFDPILSLNFLVGIVVGGLASISGAFFGALFIEFIPNVADQLTKAAPWAISGLVLIAFMYLMPDGVAGLIRRLTARLVGLARGRGRR